MKRYSLIRVILFLIFLSTAGLFASAANSFRINLIDNSSVIFVIDNDFALTFSDGLMNVTSEKETVSFELDNIDFCQIAKQKYDISTGVNKNLISDVPVVHYNGSDFTVENCASDKMIMVLTDNGIVIGEFPVNQTGCANFRINHTGIVYLVIPTTNGMKTFRFIISK